MNEFSQMMYAVPVHFHHIPEDQFLQIAVRCRGMSRGWKGNVERGGGAELDIRCYT